MKPTIAFVGVGRMGANMARRLKDCGYHVTAVNDVSQEAAQTLATELGAAAPSSLAEVTAAADVIFTVVTNDAAMRAIFTGDNLLANAQGKIFINCATLSPALQREIAGAIHAAGGSCIEASMASSISHAREGKLYLMLAGDEDAYNQPEIKELIEQISLNRRFIGASGSAAEVKALVNMVMNINTAGLAEGLGLAAALGHDLDMIREVFSQTGANSRVLETDAADMVAREHDCWFSAEHAEKDSGIAEGVAQSVGLNLPLNTATRAQYKRMVELGLGGLDKSGIAELTFKGRHA